MIEAPLRMHATVARHMPLAIPVARGGPGRRERLGKGAGVPTAPNRGPPRGEERETRKGSGCSDSDGSKPRASWAFFSASG
jgi:hypothetical protein